MPGHTNNHNQQSFLSADQNCLALSALLAPTQNREKTNIPYLLNYIELGRKLYSSKTSIKRGSQNRSQNGKTQNIFVKK
jgi:hypothetical protein